MKSCLTFIITFLALLTFGQKGSSTIDTTNYYDYAKDAGNLNWLRTSDAVPVIIDELKQAGFSYAFIGIGELLKINDTTHLVLTVSYKNDTRFGFVYEGVHGLPLNKKDREFLTSEVKKGFTQAERNLKNESNFMRVDLLPKNIFLLRQGCYWYEYGNEPSKITVTKSIIENILRQDIRNYLKQIEK